MERNEAVEWLKTIKEKYIRGGDDFYDYQRRTAIDYAVAMLEQKPQTNADRLRAMSDEELADFLEGDYGNMAVGCALQWLKQPATENLRGNNDETTHT